MDSSGKLPIVRAVTTIKVGLLELEEHIVDCRHSHQHGKTSGTPTSPRRREELHQNTETHQESLPAWSSPYSASRMCPSFCPEHPRSQSALGQNTAQDTLRILEVALLVYSLLRIPQTHVEM